MYNITATATETAAITFISVSISETDDTGHTQALAGFRTATNDVFAGLEAGTLENFLEQFVTGLVNTLTTNRDSIAGS